MWSTLETSAFANWVNISTWVYPTLLSVHGLGMAIVVGLTSAVALRLLGFPKSIPLGAYRPTLPWLLTAFFFNALSGALLFVAAASSLAANPSFQFKLVGIVLGLIVLAIMYGKLVKPAAKAEAAGETFVLPGYAKVVAIANLLIWTVSVIVSGRLIAYISVGF